MEYNKEFNEELFYNTLNYIADYYDNHHANWAAFKQEDNLGELMEGLLYGEGYNSGNSLNNIITDNETFPLAILCDLKYIQQQRLYNVEGYQKYLEDGTKYADAMMSLKVVWKENGGWEFQPGAWADSGAFKYAGYTSCEDIIEGEYKTVENITEDSSHFVRFALFLNSFERASNNPKMYKNLRAGLAIQFKEVVLVSPNEDSTYYRTNNYMNGWNGVFNYSDGKGYDGYGLSIMLLIGWWGFLNDRDIQLVYADISDSLNKLQEIPEEYKDIRTTREQNSKFVSKDYYETLCYMASCLSVNEAENNE